MNPHARSVKKCMTEEFVKNTRANCHSILRKPLQIIKDVRV